MAEFTQQGNYRGWSSLPDGRGLRIGYLQDSAFSFYYADNLEALESAASTLVPISPLRDSTLPPHLDALYIGGGFPETHGSALQTNSGFLQSLRTSILAGLPVYAECGGLMLLSESILWQRRSFGMAGILPFSVEMFSRPQGHGYTELRVKRGEGGADSLGDQRPEASPFTPR